MKLLNPITLVALALAATVSSAPTKQKPRNFNAVAREHASDRAIEKANENSAFYVPPPPPPSDDGGDDGGDGATGDEVTPFGAVFEGPI